MKILCSKYRFPSGQTPNFYANVMFPSGFGLVGGTDLYNAVIRGTFDGITYNFEGIDSSDNALKILSSEMSFEVYNIDIGGMSLFDFLELYNTDDVFKFLIEFKNDNDVTLWTGILYKDGITVPQRKKDIAQILCVGKEREFKDYFGDLELGGAGAFDTIPMEVTDLFSFRFWTAEQEGTFVYELFNRKIDIRFNGNPLYEYRVINRTYAYAPYNRTLFTGGYNVTNDTLFFKAGYVNFERDKISRFDYFNSICLAWGFIWFIHLNVLYIVERGNYHAERLTPLNLNTKIITHGIETISANYNVENIVIDGGEFFSMNIEGASDDDNGVLRTRASNGAGAVVEYYLGDGRKYVYSRNKNYSNNVYPFNFLQLNEGTKRYQLNNTDYETVIFKAENKFNLMFEGIGFGTVLYDATITNYNFPVKQTMQLNPVVLTQDNAGMLDISAPRSIDPATPNGNIIAFERELTTNDFRWTGHAGESMFRVETATRTLQTYRDYVDTNDFINNFKKYLRQNDLLQIPVETHQVISNPLTTFVFTNYDYDVRLQDKTFQPTKMTFYENFETRTNLILQEVA